MGGGWEPNQSEAVHAGMIYRGILSPVKIFAASTMLPKILVSSYPVHQSDHFESLAELLLHSNGLDY
ncbi:hypothetical protein JCM24511_10101 [Saitozyma sp. JCM 24511]|nr:hypothetical protein JCM24511_10101 [Saitozyma sp. JCM 24511]